MHCVCYAAVGASFTFCYWLRGFIVEWCDTTRCQMKSQCLARRRPSWQSETFNEFMETLDQMANTSLKKSARKERILSTPIDSSPPANIKDWMIKRTEDTDISQWLSLSLCSLCCILKVFTRNYTAIIQCGALVVPMSILLFCMCYTKDVSPNVLRHIHGVYSILLHRINIGVHSQSTPLYSTWITVKNTCFTMVYKFFFSLSVLISFRLCLKHNWKDAQDRKCVHHSQRTRPYILFHTH